MTLRDIMTPRVPTVGMDDILATIQGIFEKVRFHHLLVLSEEGEFVRVISDRDLLKQLSPYVNTASEKHRDLATLKKKGHQIMSLKLVPASADTTVEQAATLLIERSISCLPILGEDKSLLGIVTWKDILRLFIQSVNSSGPSRHSAGI
jgi:acetoin utilization protein AcuB